MRWERGAHPAGLGKPLPLQPLSQLDLGWWPRRPTVLPVTRGVRWPGTKQKEALGMVVGADGELAGVSCRSNNTPPHHLSW